MFCNMFLLILRGQPCFSYFYDTVVRTSFAGDYHDCTIVVWCTDALIVLTSTSTPQPINDLLWDPYTVNEFASVGQNGSVLFWLLDETGSECTLNFHEADVPNAVRLQHHVVRFVNIK